MLVSVCGGEEGCEQGRNGNAKRKIRVWRFEEGTYCSMLAWCSNGRARKGIRRLQRCLVEHGGTRSFGTLERYLPPVRAASLLMST
jgi:hypothetical protein